MDTKQKKRRPAGPAKTRTTRPPAAAGTKKGSGPVRPRQASAKTTAPKKRTTQQVSRPTPDVVYTPPQPFNKNRLLLRLAIVTAVVLAMTFGISIFFKVATVTVSGNEKYSAWTVREASGIREGDNLLAFGKTRAVANIKNELPYVENVRIGIKLPDTVNIEIKELDVVYSAKDTDDTWWLITAEGRIVESTDSGTAGDYTKILGLQLNAPEQGKQAVAAEQSPADTTSDDEQTQETEETLFTAPVTVTAADRLSAALSILQYLENNEIIGAAASVDVTDMGNIVLWYGEQYQVLLGDTSQLSHKIKCMDAAINGKDNLEDYDSGILDISFTIKENEIVYEPFA